MTGRKAVAGTKKGTGNKGTRNKEKYQAGRESKAERRAPPGTAHPRPRETRSSRIKAITSNNKKAVPGNTAAITQGKRRTNRRSQFVATGQE